MNGEAPRPVRALRGLVCSGAYGSGSKSAHQAVFIETPGQRLLLRRKQGPPMGDDELLQYVGHEVECDGHLLGSTLLADRIRRLP
jgi:hypothetical protein